MLNKTLGVSGFGNSPFWSNIIFLGPVIFISTSVSKFHSFSLKRISALLIPLLSKTWRRVEGDMQLVVFEVLTAVVMKSPVSWDRTQCGPLKVTDVSEEHVAFRVEEQRNPRRIYQKIGLLIDSFFATCEQWRAESFALWSSVPRWVYKLLHTHSWSWALLEKPPIVQLLKNFLAFYGTRRFIAVLTRALHWSLSWVRSIQYTLFHRISTWVNNSVMQNQLRLCGKCACL
jgi:hypothetical protein